MWERRKDTKPIYRNDLQEDHNYNIPGIFRVYLVLFYFILFFFGEGEKDTKPVSNYFIFFRAALSTIFFLAFFLLFRK
jgi:hypothetical protein